MKERPILFNGPMVRALLHGSKTQTRRVVKPQPKFDGNWFQWDAPRGSCAGNSINTKQWMHRECPYGQPGDLLWVRETWAPIESASYADGQSHECAIYRSDTEIPVEYQPRWKPSIHMPRWASRITLEITGVRVERLQDITEADAQAEGCALECMTPTGDDIGSAIHGPGGYIALWESINGPGSWAANQFVWVVEFKRVEGGAQ